MNTNDLAEVTLVHTAGSHTATWKTRDFDNNGHRPKFSFTDESGRPVDIYEVGDYGAVLVVKKPSSAANNKRLAPGSYTHELFGRDEPQ